MNAFNDMKPKRMISVPLDDLVSFVEHAKWTPTMLDTCNSEQYNQIMSDFRISRRNGYCRNLVQLHDDGTLSVSQDEGIAQR